VDFNDRAIAHLLPAMPKPIVHRISPRYIAGATDRSSGV
jgi:hypothetical protein